GLGIVVSVDIDAETVVHSSALTPRADRTFILRDVDLSCQADTPRDDVPPVSQILGGIHPAV
ncbi:MAG: hypothetical protein ACE5JP_18350, partial [Candidatus Bipolaricaulia bacterium]